MTGRKPRVLYIVYWGAGEPLGQSLVVPAVKRLATLGTDLTLVTFEKGVDFEDADYSASIRSDLQEAGVKWVRLRYHKRPRIPATLFDVLQGILRAIVLRRSGRFEIVHARTFLGGLMGIAIAPMIGAKLIYHNEGFYPDEQVDGGFWREGSPTHRMAKWLEQKMYATADAIIVMSRRARAVVAKIPRVRERGTQVVVVPSCVDLELFEGSPSTTNGVLRLVYSGSVGGRYILDRVGRFVSIAAEVLGDLHLQVLSRAEPSLVGSMLHEGGLPQSAWSMESVPYNSMPSRLARAQAGLFFLSRGLSEHGCSPTKVGEYWAMGLPVITTANVSDIDEIIERERVGVIVRGHDDADYRRAAEELSLLLSDPDLSRRCRRAAEEHYALEPACERQYRLYLNILGSADAEGMA